ncbi:MAG: PD-(D/E)XK nuclease family protein [Gammaproteobacteria bacterium]|jgi:hypothetical protein
MNIFHVLSQGKSRLHEPSMSAMLGYLLDSNKDHGLGDAFVRKFIEFQDNSILSRILQRDFINSQVSLEEPYRLDGKRKDIDIQIIILDEKKKEEHRIIIENKIKTGAANPKQLKEYYQAILEEEKNIKNLHMIFLTPNSNSTLLSNEYSNLKLKEKHTHTKKWIYWSENDGSGGVLSIIKEILSLEMQGAINPINEYMRHTLKAFVNHSSSITESNGKRTMRTGEDIGEIIDEVVIKINDGKEYRVIRRDSTQIQVFNNETGDKEVARYILAQYIDENNIDIHHSNLNTRSIGKKFFDWHKKSNN